MGRSTTPTFRLEIDEIRLSDHRRFRSTQSWDTKRAGRPTEDTLRAYVDRIEASTLPGGTNEHLGASRVLRAYVVRQSSGAVVASYDVASEPAFVAV